MNRFTIYNASAGSGKTYTLAVQYITRLIMGSKEISDSYRQVLAVTFTNKATAEMKDRILQQLYGIGVDLPSSKGYMHSVQQALGRMGIYMEQEDIRVRARKVLHDILHDYSHFRVETIDSFFRSVLNDMSRELGLTAGLRTDIDQQRAISEAVDRIIEQLDQHDNVRHWITDFVREQISDGERWDVARLIKEFANHLFDQSYLENQQALTDFLTDDAQTLRLRDKIEECRRQIFGGIEEVIANLEEVAPDKQTDGYGNIIADFSRFKYGRDINTHIANLRKVLTGGDLPKISNRIHSFADDSSNLINSGTKDTSELISLSTEVSQRIGDMIRLEEYILPLLNSINLTRQNINPMRLLGTVSRKVNEVTQEKGSFLLANTPILLHRMVSKDDTSFIYERTGTQLKHVMLDEFQDTSALQWSNFQTLLAENMSSGGSTLIVGDVKQSIYRWRGGDCNILAHLPKEMQRYNPLCANLSTNYRSTRRIINFNNALYSNITQQVNSQRSSGEDWDINNIYKTPEQDIPASRPDNGFVQITHYHDSDMTSAHDGALEDMCNNIAQLLSKGHAPDDIAILIRRKKEIDMVARAFAKYLPDIPLVSDEVFRLNQSTAINIIINALRTILHTDDRASIGRLVYLYQTKVLKQDRDLDDLYDDVDIQHYFKSSCRLLPDGFNNIDTLARMPVFELIMRLADMFQINKIPGQSAYLMAFYDLVADSLSDFSSTLATLLHYWDEILCNKSIPGGEVKGINIITIHRAKGLQWKTVMIPFCDWKIHDEYHYGSIFWSAPKDNRLLCGLPVVAVPLKKDAANSIFAEDYINELQNQRIDNLNLLYVATTRPENNLYIWGYGKDPKTNKEGEKSNRAMIQLISDTFDNLPQGNLTKNDDFIQYIYGNPIISEQPETSRSNDNRLNIAYNTQDIHCIPYPALMHFKQSHEAARFTGNRDETTLTSKQTSYINTGSVLHAIFASITTIEDMECVIKTLPTNVVTTIDGKDLSQRARQLLDKGCHDRRVAEWFSGRYALHNECTIVAKDPETGRAHEYRPDRVMSDDNHIIVVDFKFGIPKNEHIEQVANYKKLLSQMYANKTIQAYIWYVYKNEITEI